MSGGQLAGASGLPEETSFAMADPMLQKMNSAPQGWDAVKKTFQIYPQVHPISGKSEGN